jgi:signal transduction histidine kinase
VEFGSVFLFLNGFRVFPIGEETDDTFGLNRRKQQGSSRYLGTRDLLGRIDVTAPAGMFREASSRDAGLIEDARSRDLYEAIRRKAIFRLERYVVGVTWPDKLDADREDSSGLEQLPTRGRAAQLIAQLAATGSVEIEYYDPDIVELFEADAAALDTALQSLVSIAESRGDRDLLARVEAARARQATLERSEREAAEAAREARAAVARADERIALLERQATYLASTQDMTVQQMGLLLHQVLIYAGHIGAALDRGLGNLREAVDAAKEFAGEVDDEDLVAAAAAVRHHTTKVLDDLEYIHLENDRLMAVARFASNARFDLETDKLDGDIVEFLDEYVNQVRVGRDGAGSIVFEANGLSQPAKFPPVDLVVVVDNLMDNARKHGARQLKMKARQSRAGKIEVLVSDDGRGMDEDRIDARKIFDKGYSSTEGGTGLGLFHVRQVLQRMGGSIELDPQRQRGRADFVITLPRGAK